LLGYETWQKTKIFGEKTAAARSGPEWRHSKKKFLAGCFKTPSGRLEDWTVNGPCHLYKPYFSEDARFGKKIYSQISKKK